MTNATESDSKLVRDIISHANANRSQYLDCLIALSRIPSVSHSDFDPIHVRSSAEFVLEKLKKYTPNARLLEIPDTHPYVYGELGNDPSKPTLLIYAHHDVQPPLDESRWLSDPFEPEIRNGRLFGRGTADDKAGIVAVLAAIDSYHALGKELPVNLKFLFEGEEELGSPNLLKFFDKYGDLLKADAYVLTDTANTEQIDENGVTIDVPALTVSLRGFIKFTLTVTALESEKHSGLYSGPVPDANMELAKLLAKLTDDENNILIPGIEDEARVLSDHEIGQLLKVPFNEKSFRRETQLVDQANFIGRHHDGTWKQHPYLQMWRKPRLAVSYYKGGDRPGNVVLPFATATIDLRTAPGMTHDRTAKLVEDFLRKNVSPNVHLEIKTNKRGKPWETNTLSPYFLAGKKALSKGFCVPAVEVGCGGAIPFVAPFSELTNGKSPMLLIGVEDAKSNAHSVNESLNIGSFYNTINSLIYLFDEVGRLKAVEGK